MEEVSKVPPPRPSKVKTNDQLVVGGAEKPLAAGTVPPFTSSRTRRKKRSLSVSPDEEFSVILRSSLAGINLEKKR